MPPEATDFENGGPAAPMQIDERQVVRLLALIRVAVGVGLLLAPTLAGRPWLGDSARVPAVRLALRMVGGRDIVLGVGLLAALESGDDPRPWVRLSAAVDTADAAATVLGARRLPRRVWAVALTASGAAAAGFASADRLG